MTTRTALKGEYVVVQDITKVEATIELDSFGVDGTDVVADGDGTPWVSYINESYTVDTHIWAQTRDGRRVVRFERPIGYGGSSLMGALYMTGNTAYHAFNPMTHHIEWSALFYLDDAFAVVRFETAGYNSWIEVDLEVEPDGTALHAFNFILPPERVYPWPDNPKDSTAKNPADLAGWYWVKMYLEKGLVSQRAKYWKLGDDEPASWLLTITPDRRPWSRIFPCVLVANYNPPITADMHAEVATVKYKVWR